MSETTMIHAQAAETCRNCGSPLAGDQRYCLNCGTRRGEPRVDPLREAAGVTAMAAAPPIEVARPTIVDRAGGPAGIAAMLLAAVGVGLLIGRDHDTEVRTVLQRAPVVNVQGTPGAAVAPGAVTGAAGAAGAGTPSDSVTAGGSDAASGDAAGGKASSKSSKPAAKALSSAEKKRASSATKAAQNKIKNAPKTVGTGGAAPKKDSKAPGGGSGSESIG